MARAAFAGDEPVELLLERDSASRYQIVIFGEESRTAYDRVHLSEYFSGKTEADLLLATPSAPWMSVMPW